jgi:hypothetical protein
MRSTHVSGRSPHRDERGMSLVFVGVGFMGFVAATMLAIDVGMLMTARSQAQNSADAGAHAGAVALAFDDYNDRSTGGPAVTNALARAKANLVIDKEVNVVPADVVFLPGSFGEMNRVQVTVYRTAARGNPIGLFMAPLFNVDTADISAIAIAEASPASAMDCVLPFMIPDKWNERTSPPYDAVNSTFQLYTKTPNGVPLAVPDQYIGQQAGVKVPDYTGYDAIRDRGTKVILKASNDTNVSPSIYNPIVIPGMGRGADDYSAAISGCVHANFEWDQDITVEPGNMTGPTKKGVEDLEALDPNARWDPDCLCVKDSQYPVSPRIRPIPLYDPHYYEAGKQGGRNADFKVANFLGVFVDGMQGNDVVAYITPIAGSGGSGAGPTPGNAFPYVIRIVR